MPLSEAFATRKMCIGPPKQGHAEKRKGPKYFKAGQRPASSAYDPKLRGGGEAQKVDFAAILKG